MILFTLLNALGAAADSTMEEAPSVVSGAVVFVVLLLLIAGVCVLTFLAKKLEERRKLEQARRHVAEEAQARAVRVEVHGDTSVERNANIRETVRTNLFGDHAQP